MPSSNVEEDINTGTAIISNLDSVREPRVLTIDFDVQYGNYSGGQVIAVTESGSRRSHGDAFRSLRNTEIDTRNFFSPDRAELGRKPCGGMLRSRVFCKLVRAQDARLVQPGFEVLF